MENILTKSQHQALIGLENWYYGPYGFAILHGAAGMGKTYLLNVFLEKLSSKLKPLLLADTNEAVNVLKQITHGKYPAQTICSALGLTLKSDGAKQVLTKTATPDLSEYNLLVVDEASMLDENKLQYLEETGLYILYSGHVSQLPPVIETLKINDPCVSPIFQFDYPTFNLIEPIRNSGEIFEFCRQAEQLIYKRGILPYKFKVSQQFVKNYLQTDKDKIFNNETVFLAYTNKQVALLNQLARLAIYNRKTFELDLFYPKDKVIFRSPTAVFNLPVKDNTTKLEQLLRISSKYKVITTNSRGVVQSAKTKTVMGVLCNELFVNINTFEEQFNGYVYVALDDIAKAALQKKMYFAALYESNKTVASKKWDSYHNLSYVLSNTKHSYAMTVHCAQGSTIPNVFVDSDDIAKCKNPILRKKLEYVAVSRASENLFRL